MEGESSPLDKPVLFRASIENVQQRNTLENHNLHGDRLPTKGELYVSFLDRVSCRIYCPFGPCFWQSQWLNFKSKFDCLAFQAMTFPDGVVRFLDGPANDRTPQRQSHFTWVPIK